MAHETNLERLEGLYQSLFDSLLTAQPPDSSLMIKSLGTIQPNHWLIEGIAVRAAQERGRQIILDSTAQASSVPRLEFQSLTSDIQYQKIDKKYMSRQTKVQLYVKYILADGKTVFAKKFTQAKCDTIPRNQISELEDEQLAFTQGKMPRTAVRLLEPVAASTLTALVIFLFYFYRSH